MSTIIGKTFLLVVAIAALVLSGRGTIAAFQASANAPTIQAAPFASGTLGEGENRVVDNRCGYRSCWNVEKFLAPVRDQDGNVLHDGQGRQVWVEDNAGAPSPGKAVEVYESRGTLVEYTTVQPPAVTDDVTLWWLLLGLLLTVVTGFIGFGALAALAFLADGIGGYRRRMAY